MLSRIKIDRKSRIPLYIQIKNQIQSMILHEVLPDGIRLPSTRKLAKDLGVTRSTIVAAYNELSAEKLVESHVGEGTSVSRKKLAIDEREDVFPLDWSRYYSISSQSIYDTTIKEAMDLSSHKQIL